MEELRKQWITSEKEYREGEVFVYRQKFTASQVKKAVFYGTALGVYEAELNGTKIGRQMFAPGFSYYPRRVLYQTHEVTELLREGENTLTVYLGQGWYCGRFLCENQTQIYGEQPAVAWILELEDAAGSRKIVSDETVEELESPYEYAGEYDGEIYFADGRENVTGHAAAYTKETPFALEPTLTEVRLQDEMSVRETTVQGDVTILDFGQNFAGIVEIDPSFLTNETITIRHGEILNADGSLYTANLRRAKATIVYHAGAEKKKYRPRFTYMGFRYMELSGAAYQPGMIRAYALHTEMKRTGYFSCENPLVQKLYENQVWGQKSNYVEVPTDCPQRDERMGYTGDGQVFALTGAYNFNTDAFWKNFLRDLELGQLDNTEGYVCATVPQTGPAGIGFISMLGWGNAVTILPEMMYRQFGDEEALPRQYESMKLFVEAEIRKMGKKNLWIGPSLGDWLAMGKGIAWQAMHNNPVSNAFIVHDLKVISETAERLGKREDAARYRRQLAATTDAYIKKFVSKNGIVAKDYQSAYIMALKYVLPEGELRERVKKNFVANIRKNGLQTGFFATEHLLPLLVEAGEQKLAYDVLLQENCPGWMYQVKCGATTTWERWDALKPDGTVNEEKMAGSGENMVSFNHYAFGSVGEFYYQYILGIRPEKPGFAKLHFAPYPDERLGGVSGSYLSVAGKIESAWRYEPDGCHIRLATPVEAVVLLPDGRSENVPAGTYEWTVKRP
ncbi:MAG: family 78 glycoside hydrolase catalytic domain [Roseburia hominis]|uniref:alpha-L-rhamnosidase n=1 Tax=Roseburia hominis TaxID=301301 RepID=UPI0026DBCDED|nr:alpha-L-rhamnosidase [Roseburia hominis]